jgi:ABC-type sugar transport system ATPase subunit
MPVAPGSSTDLGTTTQVAARATGLTRTYGSGAAFVRALDGVNLEIATGRFTAVMGPSGSAKSTLMHALAGLDTPTSGSVTVAGRELAEMSDRTLTVFRRDHIGFVFQSFNLLPMLTAGQNILLPVDLAGVRADAETSRPATWTAARAGAGPDGRDGDPRPGRRLLRRRRRGPRGRPRHEQRASGPMRQVMWASVRIYARRYVATVVTIGVGFVPAPRRGPSRPARRGSTRPRAGPARGRSASGAASGG